MVEVAILHHNGAVRMHNTLVFALALLLLSALANVGLVWAFIQMGRRMATLEKQVEKAEKAKNETAQAATTLKLRTQAAIAGLRDFVSDLERITK
jgi:cell division protein FtsB